MSTRALGRVTRLMIAVCLALLTTPGLVAQQQSLLGLYDVQMTVTSIEGGPPQATAPASKGLMALCTYEGQLNITSQSGSVFSGTGELSKTSGDVICPPDLVGNIEGSANGSAINGGITGTGPNNGQFADFTGMILLMAPQPSPTKLLPGPLQFSGDFAVSMSPNIFPAGSWSAVRLPAPGVAIPTLGALGLTTLVLLVLGAGLWVLRRA